MISMAQRFLSVADFDSILDAYSGRLVVHTPRTRTLDGFSGGESFSNGTPANIKCHFFRQSQKWMFDKAAMIEGGDAVVLIKAADAAAENNLITADGVVYVIKNFINVPGVFDSTSLTPTMVYSYCNLFIYDES